jgi:hypothetical protein
VLLVFVDETSDQKFKDYLGFCVATLNEKFYPSLKQTALEILKDIDWDPSIEFKGSYLFSQSKGCDGVQVVTRLDAAHRLLDLNTAKINSRLRFYYGGMKSENHAQDYLQSVPELLRVSLPKPPKGAGKNLISVMCDERSDVSSEQLHEAIEPAVSARGYVLLEKVVSARSATQTVGIMFADLVGYLMGRVETIGTDLELFEGLTEEQMEQHGKLKKLRASTELIEKIKSLDVYTHSTRPAT